MGPSRRAPCPSPSREGRCALIIRLPRLAGLVLLLLATPVSAKADDFATLVGNLAGDSFVEKEKAVIGLG